MPKKTSIKNSEIKNAEIKKLDTKLKELNLKLKNINLENQDKVFMNTLSSLVSTLSTTSQLSSSDTIITKNNYSFISNDRSTLSYAHKTHGIVQTLIDQPVEDGYRGGIEIKSEQLDEDNVKDIYNWMTKNNILETFKNAIKWTRLFGGGGIVINTIGKSDKPINEESINEDTPLEFYDVDLWELNSQLIQTGSAKGVNNSIRPPYENILEVPYVYYDVKLHKDRVLKMNGKKAPSFIRPILRGWGMSEVERLIRSINQYLKNNDLIFELLDEAKIDVYKMKNFNTLLSVKNSTGTEKVRKRIELSNKAKNYQNAILLDNEDDYEQKKIDFKGLSEILKDIRIGIASDLKMPLTKLFGISSAGFNSGEDDIENYNSMIESEIRRKYDCHLIEIIKLICQKLFQFIPDDLRIEYKALRILSAVEEEDVKNKKFERANILYQQGVISLDEFKQIINTDGLVSIDLQSEGSELYKVDTMEKEEDKDNKEKKNSLFKKLFRK
jgi:phage-related protein (TIGR01555 family)